MWHVNIFILIQPIRNRYFFCLRISNAVQRVFHDMIPYFNCVFFSLLLLCFITREINTLSLSLSLYSTLSLLKLTNNYNQHYQYFQIVLKQFVDEFNQYWSPKGVIFEKKSLDLPSGREWSPLTPTGLRRLGSPPPRPPPVLQNFADSWKVWSKLLQTLPPTLSKILHTLGFAILHSLQSLPRPCQACTSKCDLRPNTVIVTSGQQTESAEAVRSTM